MIAVQGHEKQVEQLLGSLKERRLHHAHLFTGIEGIGKKRVAFLLASKLLESNKVEKNSHPDFHFVSADGAKIKIERIRELKQKIYLHPLEAEAKVVLIDNAEQMTESAANALLKILEEPPADTYFFLISSKPFRLLPTLRSRCQRVPFSPMGDKETFLFLTSQGIKPEEAKQRVAYACGSPKVALEFDPNFLDQTQKQLEDVQKEKTPAAILALSESWSNEEEKVPFLLTTLATLWHQKVMTAPDAARRGACIQQWQSIQRAMTDLEMNANKQLLLENLLFTLSAP